MKAFGINEPFRGLLPAGCVLTQVGASQNGVLEIPKAALGGSALRGGEVEWCFRLRGAEAEAWARVDAGNTEALDQQFVSELVEDVLPAVEICGSRMVGLVQVKNPLFPLPNIVNFVRITLYNPSQTPTRTLFQS